MSQRFKADWDRRRKASRAQTSGPHDRYGGVLSLSGTKTGWFYVEEIGGRWHFVTPDGHAFFSLGATHAVECIRRDELNLFATKYGQSEERLAASRSCWPIF